MRRLNITGIGRLGGPVRREMTSLTSSWKNLELLSNAGQLRREEKALSAQLLSLKAQASSLGADSIKPAGSSSGGVQRDMQRHFFHK